MKTFLGIVIAAGALSVPILVLAFAPAPDAGGKSIEFKTYDGYAESRDSGLHGADSFLALSGWAEFTHVFQPVVTPRGIPDPIGKSAFDANLFVAVIKRDEALWDFKVEKVMANGDTLTISYRTTPRKGGYSPRGETLRETRTMWIGTGPRVTTKVETIKKWETRKYETRKYEVGTSKETARVATAKGTEKRLETAKKDVETKKEDTKKEDTKPLAKDTVKRLEKGTHRTPNYETGKVYDTERQRPGPSNFDSTLILSVPKEKYTTVIFIENGRKVGSARVGN